MKRNSSSRLPLNTGLQHPDMRRCSQTRSPKSFLSLLSPFSPSSFLPWFLFYLFKRGSHEAKWPPSCHVAKDDIEFLIPLAKCWAYRPAPPQLVYKPRALACWASTSLQSQSLNEHVLLTQVCVIILHDEDAQEVAVFIINSRIYLRWGAWEVPQHFF